jgi:hypothetical protein
MYLSVIIKWRKEIKNAVGWDIWKKKTIWVFHYANALVILLRCLGSFHDKRK